MKTGAKSLVITVFAVITMLMLLLLAAPPSPAPPSAAPAAAPATAIPPAARPAPAPTATASRYYFDVANHSADDFLALLKRAQTIYAETPPAERPALEVVMVLHGPDIAFFDPASRDEYEDIVDLAAQLDALDVFDFKVCTRAANSRGLDRDDLPPFLEFVPYGPGELERLEQAGYVRL